MSDDPFSEPQDVEATVVRPQPGGKPAAAPAGAPPKAAGAVLALPAVGRSPLLAAAAPLLATAIRIGERGSRPDPDQLRRSMVDAVREFESRALATGLDTRTLRAARYALCATIDDLVLSTPWGSHSTWTGQSLTSTFHNEVFGGERFFEILEQMQHDLGRNSDHNMPRLRRASLEKPNTPAEGIISRPEFCGKATIYNGNRSLSGSVIRPELSSGK